MAQKSTTLTVAFLALIFSGIILTGLGIAGTTTLEAFGIKISTTLAGPVLIVLAIVLLIVAGQLGIEPRLPGT